MGVGGRMEVQVSSRPNKWFRTASQSGGQGRTFVLKRAGEKPDTRIKLNPSTFIEVNRLVFRT